MRLFGIDAPELDHPYGKKSKWAMIHLCRGQEITATVTGELSYDRHVAVCTLPDGRDLSEELVKQGLALDWPAFSGGRYRQFEPGGVRKRLWRASTRQWGAPGWNDLPTSRPEAPTAGSGPRRVPPGASSPRSPGPSGSPRDEPRW
ncbi:hypothetical protein F3S47_15055 [Histidinibacterium aquaticum]|uniref:TNase-like domain-containing protein n=1 Tax=Histidinibacterium aquaticum TaxID=2613962 RepID=A0A5J5GI18_9RHOB|nr:hypothetical protein F3S47_15055 [Histidinibacterium aquaticum]